MISKLLHIFIYKFYSTSNIQHSKESVAKSVLDLHLEDKYPVGRSKAMWLDKIRTDMKKSKSQSQ